MATVFQAWIDQTVRDKEAVLAPLGDIQVVGRQWALLAGREVLQEVEEPTLEGIQTCEVLAFYWFSRDEPQRHNLFSGVTYQAIRTMVLESTSNRPSRSAVPLSGETSSETMRRVFWAAWMASCLNSDHYIAGTSIDPQTMSVSLPISESGFRDVKIETQGTLSMSIGDRTTVTRDDTTVSPISTAAEAMKLVLIWARIRDYIETRPDSSMQQALTDLFTIDQELTSWSANLSDNFCYSQRNLYEFLVVKQDVGYSAVHAIRHQCRLVLHSSLVPRLSGRPAPKGVPLEIVRSSASMALESAEELSTLAADLSALQWDSARLAPIIGYCQYVSATTQLAFSASSSERTSWTNRAKILSSMKLLKEMKQYWTHLERLWERLLLLYKIEGQNPLTSPTTVSVAQGAANHSCNSSSSDVLDHIAQPRCPKRFPEPISDSVLQYGLRKIRSRIADEDTISGLAGVVEEETRQAQAAELSREMDYMSQPQKRPCVPTASVPSQSTVEGTVVLETSEEPSEYHMSNGSIPHSKPMHGHISEWWEPDPDLLSMLPLLDTDELLQGIGDMQFPELAFDSDAIGSSALDLLAGDST